MGFFDNFFAFLFETNNPEVKKKRVLKQIAKEINKNKYRKFYKTISGEVTPIMESFFYDVYKTVIVAHSLMKNADKSVILRQLTIEAFMSKELREIYDRLSPDSIEEQAKTMPPKELSHQLEEDMNTFSSALSITDINTIDHCYKLIIGFTEFVSFDFPSLLKKIDPRFKEQNVHYQPQWRPVSGRYLVENIKDFLALPPLEATPEEWKKIFEILKKYKAGVTMVEPNQWKKLLLCLQDVQRSGILTLIVRYISQNPAWQQSFQAEEEFIVEAYLKIKKAEIQGCIEKIITDKLANKRTALANQLFKAADITRLQYYTNANNEVYIKRNLEGFAYIDALNYLKAFLIDYNDVRELCDLFLIRGQWASQELSRQISMGLHEITEISEQLTAFDESLGDSGINGLKLKGQISKFKSDKGQVTHLKVTLSIINNEAKEMISRAIMSFTLVGNYLKDLRADYKKSHPTLLINWKELESVSEHPIVQRMETDPQIIENFISLMQLFVSEE
jgi:hypothetical protein